MKIDNQPSHFDPALQADRTDSVKRVETDAAGRTGSRGGDAVTLSSTAHLAAKAVAEATKVDAARADEIARAKSLLAGGALGENAERLADAILARTLDTN
jgi:anti-sigma28 factor (negative regulator of flagellin synthesis)